MAKIILVSKYVNATSWQLAQALKSQQHEVVLLTSYGEIPPQDTQGIEFMGYFKKWSLLEGLRIIPGLFGLHPQILHVLLDEDKLRNYGEKSGSDSPLIFLEMKREEKYDHFIHRGHFYIAQKKYEEAKNCFYKARNYRDTAEVLTLIAWTYSLLDDKAQAKSYCLKAIQHDPQYGPAYNDFGNYILSEGQAEESLRWFELAKRAHNYQNREYPYINAGRAYVLMRNYEQALTEFSLALTIAPHHQELHETVTKLKMNLEKSHEPVEEKSTLRKFPNKFGDENHPEST